MDHGKLARGSSTAAAGSTSTRPSWIVFLSTACNYAPFCAYCWATPINEESLGSFLVGLAITTVLVAVYVIGLVVLLARLGYLRVGLVAVLPFVLLWLPVTVPTVVGSLAGGWSGGWLVGTAGAVVGAIVGLVSGWLIMREMLLQVARNALAAKQAEPDAAADRPRE